MTVPVDASLLEKLRAEALDALLDDYVSIGRMQTFATRISSGLSPGDVRLLVTEVLASLVSHPTAKVVDASFEHSFTTPEQVRAHVDNTWVETGPRPVTGEVAWVVKRDFELPPRAADGSAQDF